MGKLIYEETIPVVSHFFYLTYVKNTGGAWSILSGNSFLLLGIGICFLVGLVYYMIKKDTFTSFEVVSYSLLIGGVLGNFIDRMIYGGVIDYLGFIFGNYYFPIFNYADICIVVGVGLLLIDGIRSESYGNRSK